MSAGFQCIGDSGNTQIDQNYFNFVFVQKGALSFTYNSAGGSDNVRTVSYTGTNPMLFLNPTTLFLQMGSPTRSGSTWTWTITGWSAAAGVTTETLSYFIFDSQPATETHYGVNIYNAAGAVVFNSDYKPLRINNIFAVSTSTGVQGSGSGGSGVYAGMLPTPYVSAHVIAGPIGVWVWQTYRMTSGYQFETSTYTQNGPLVNGGTGGSMGVIADVGGL